MKFKYYLQGAGVGVIVTTIVLAIIFAVMPKEIPDSEIVARAEALGMSYTNTQDAAVSEVSDTSDGDVGSISQETSPADSDVGFSFDYEEDPEQTLSSDTADSMVSDENTVAGEDADPGANSDSGDNSDPGDKSEDTEKTGDEPEDTEKTGDEPEDTEKTGDEPEDTEKTGDEPEDTEKTGDEPEDTEKTGDESEDTEKTGDETEDTEKTGDEGETKSGEDEAALGDDVVFKVSPGESSLTVSKHLKKAGLVDDAEKFNKYLCDRHIDDIIKVGSFSLQTDMSYEKLARVLTGR